ncbi:MAG: TauD/TfdA family dioxygenase [Actinomycetota bacterium]|nr:TauD/TfdA family dioxygenase [Actinomycetota bacterium]
MTTLTEHVLPMVIEVPAWAAVEAPDLPIGDERFVRAAGHAARTLPAQVHDALIDFADAPPQAGAIVLRGMPVGTLGRTPDSPTSPTTKDRVSEFTLLTVARRLGQPVGYLPEHGGDLVQNLVPTRSSADRQVSTSSKVELMFHTEAAFHPHRPKYLMLLCLRGDSNAVTTLSSIFEVLPHLPRELVDTLFQPRFRTAVDESYLHGRSNVLGAPAPVLSGERDRPSMVFDADLMVGMDEEADDALRALGAAVAGCHTGLSLQAGDLLVVDNSVAIHGRSPYQPRFDGFDRWIQRSMAVTDLAASAGERNGRVIVTHFGV